MMASPDFSLHIQDAWNFLHATATLFIPASIWFFLIQTSISPLTLLWQRSPILITKFNGHFSVKKCSLAPCVISRPTNSFSFIKHLELLLSWTCFFPLVSLTEHPSSFYFHLWPTSKTVQKKSYFQVLPLLLTCKFSQSSTLLLSYLLSLPGSDNSYPLSTVAPVLRPRFLNAH
jgi:hypothetical protein